jgi:hypothetical protein
MQCAIKNKNRRRNKTLNMVALKFTAANTQRDAMACLTPPSPSLSAGGVTSAIKPLHPFAERCSAYKQAFWNIPRPFQFPVPLIISAALNAILPPPYNLPRASNQTL